VRVSGVSLAALPGGEHPGPRRPLRWHIHHGLAAGGAPVAACFLDDPLARFGLCGGWDRLVTGASLGTLFEAPGSWAAEARGMIADVSVNLH